MTIKVTLQKDGKCTRREYRTHKRAISGLQRWFGSNQGMAVVYQPGHQPVMYKSLHELPLKPLSTDTDFYRTQAWRSLRVEVLNDSNSRCCLCGNSADNGMIMHVDHIKPRSLFPELALDKENLQVLCEDCNMGKMTREFSVK